MWSWGRRKRPAREEPTRLKAEAACAIAEAAVSDFYRGTMRAHVPERRNGLLIWTVVSATIGSGRTIEVDDATGEVIRLGRWGKR